MRVILWIIFLILFTWVFLGLKKSSDQDRIEKENNIQNVIDSLQNVIDSLNKPSNVWEDLYPEAIYPPGKKDILYDTIHYYLLLCLLKVVIMILLTELVKMQ